MQTLQTELRNRQHEIAMLKEVGEAVCSELNVETVLRLVAERARALINAGTLLIPILDPECSQYTYRAGCGDNADEIVGESLPLDFGVCGWVWKNKRPWWRGTLAELEEHERNQWEHEAGTLIMVPLIGRRHFLGGIAGINKVGGGEFDRRDLDLLTLFANQASIAIENAKLFEETELARQSAERYQQELQLLNTDLAKTAAELEHLALHDCLTSLPNRSLIHDRLHQAIIYAQRQRLPTAIIMVDLDGFKDVNDTLGHNMGDQLLKKVGELFRQALKNTDTVGRLGGDEFAIVLPGVGPEMAASVATRLLNVLETPVDLNGHLISVTASLGIAVYPSHGDSVETLLKRADIAMYVAKRSRNGFFVYDSAEDESNPGRLTMLRELRDAIGARELELHYQPKVDLRTGMITGVEALARWPNPNGGFIPPDDFVPVLEQTGLIKTFTLWVLETALRQASDWHLQGLDISVAVNLSMHNLRDPRLCEKLAALLERWNFRRESLILEITESAIMGDATQILRTLQQLKEMGIELSIDDFGTGYSSLGHLKKMPVSELKIDRSFVIEMTTNHDSEIIVHSTIDLAHNLGLRVIAEGVESEQSLELLRKLDCDLIQGYLISRPLTAARLIGFLHDGRWPVRRSPPSAAPPLPIALP